jgi:hypothetical protein
MKTKGFVVDPGQPFVPRFPIPQSQGKRAGRSLLTWEKPHKIHLTQECGRNSETPLQRTFWKWEPRWTLPIHSFPFFYVRASPAITISGDGEQELNAGYTRSNVYQEVKCNYISKSPRRRENKQKGTNEERTTIHRKQSEAK